MNVKTQNLLKHGRRTNFISKCAFKCVLARNTEIPFKQQSNDDRMMPSYNRISFIILFLLFSVKNIQNSEIPTFGRNNILMKSFEKFYFKF
jgi:uncharacterized Fe-S radical SAM superfamily protein PflX